MLAVKKKEFGQTWLHVQVIAWPCAKFKTINQTDTSWLNIS